MEKLDDVKKVMQETGQFTAEVLDALTQADIDSVANAKPLPDGNYPTDARPLFRTWSGNNFRIVSGKWFWDDTPGSQCGRTRTWEYKPQPGASYRQAGRCPQGYAWFEMQIP